MRESPPPMIKTSSNRFSFWRHSTATGTCTHISNLGNFSATETVFYCWFFFICVPRQNNWTKVVSKFCLLDLAPMLAALHMFVFFFCLQSLVNRKKCIKFSLTDTFLIYFDAIYPMRRKICISIACFFLWWWWCWCRGTLEVLFCLAEGSRRWTRTYYMRAHYMLLSPVRNLMMKYYRWK